MNEYRKKVQEILSRNKWEPIPEMPEDMLPDGAEDSSQENLNNFQLNEKPFDSLSGAPEISPQDLIIDKPTIDQPILESQNRQPTSVDRFLSMFKPKTPEDLSGLSEDERLNREYENTLKSKERALMIDNLVNSINKVSAGLAGTGGAGAVLKVDESETGTKDIYDTKLKGVLERIAMSRKKREAEDKQKADEFADNQRKLDAEERRRETQENRDRWYNLAKDKVEENKGIIEDKEVNKLKDEINDSNIPKMISQLNVINDKLNEYGGSLYDLPKKDLPGVGPIDKYIPEFMLGKDSSLRNNIAALANSLRHEDFGSSQTAQEMKNFIEESSTGSLSSEKQTMRFLQQLGNYVKDKAKNLEAVKPEVKEKYREYKGGKLPSETIRFDKSTSLNKNEVIKRDPKTGQNAIFNADTKEFIRWVK